MNTTSIIVEILVIGYTSLLWIIPLLLSFFDVSFTNLLSDIQKYKEWSPIVAILLTAIAYQIGWLIDYLSYLFFYYVGIARIQEGKHIPNKQILGFYFIGIGRKAKRDYIPNKMFYHYYNVVCQKGSQVIHESLRTDLSFIRFARSGIVNFPLIGLALKFTLKSWSILIICMIIASFCFLVLIKRWKHYYAKIKISYEHLYCKQQKWWVENAITPWFLLKRTSSEQSTF